MRQPRVARAGTARAGVLCLDERYLRGCCSPELAHVLWLLWGQAALVVPWMVARASGGHPAPRTGGAWLSPSLRPNAGAVAVGGERSSVLQLGTDPSGGLGNYGSALKQGDPSPAGLGGACNAAAADVARTGCVWGPRPPLDKAAEVWQSCLCRS